MMILPRQARDKHRENSKKDAVFRLPFFCDLFFLSRRSAHITISYTETMVLYLVRMGALVLRIA
jgi:hypothetical protein